MRVVAKAITGALAAGLAALTTGLADGHATWPEWVVVAVATITAGLAVFEVPNTTGDEK